MDSIIANENRSRVEMEKTASVYMVRPTGSPAAIRRGRRLAAKIRKQLKMTMAGTLEETMIRLRGRSWSS